MRTLVVLSAILSSYGCGSSARLSSESSGGPSLVVPAHFAEREGPPKKQTLTRLTESADAGVSQKPVPRPSPPDPPPLVTTGQWIYRFDYSRGRIVVGKVTRKDFDRPVPTERRVGRFAVELWVGRELVDRVRFDFPLLAADPAPDKGKKAIHEPGAFGPGAETSREVMVPASERATKAVLVDRLNGHETPLPWPPDAEGTPEGASSAR